jgi:hypothetical protein
MRLWTLHPRYLDAQELVALRREALLARAVLRGETRGYRHHLQLRRFRDHPAPRTALNAYLRAILGEAEARGYTFRRGSVGPRRAGVLLTVTRGQLAYEWRHLRRKLRSRSPRLHVRWRRLATPEPHPLFRIVPGGIAARETLSIPRPRAHHSRKEGRSDGRRR